MLLLKALEKLIRIKNNHFFSTYLEKNPSAAFIISDLGPDT
jgi:hypothetical protein